jgi:MtN3 and saliva related transmembrane protein
MSLLEFLNADVIGAIGATLTTFAFVPQVIQIWRSKSARDISLPMYSCFTLGLVCWLTYGVLILSTLIIVTNIITLLLAASVILMKIRWG